MGDMGDLYNDLKGHRQTQRQARNTQAMQMVNDVRDTVDSLTVDASGTWNITKGQQKIQFYPTKGTWQHNGRMMHGGIFQFINWLEKQ
jgi:hypothetical protein